MVSSAPRPAAAAGPRRQPGLTFASYAATYSSMDFFVHRNVCGGHRRRRQERLGRIRILSQGAPGRRLDSPEQTQPLPRLPRTLPARMLSAPTVTAVHTAGPAPLPCQACPPRHAPRCGSARRSSACPGRCRGSCPAPPRSHTTHTCPSCCSRHGSNTSTWWRPARQRGSSHPPNSRKTLDTGFFMSDFDSEGARYPLSGCRSP